MNIPAQAGTYRLYRCEPIAWRGTENPRRENKRKRTAPPARVAKPRHHPAELTSACLVSIGEFVTRGLPVLTYIFTHRINERGLPQLAERRTAMTAETVRDSRRGGGTSLPWEWLRGHLDRRRFAGSLRDSALRAHAYCDV
jgi:hypothetical protein